MLRQQLTKPYEPTQSITFEHNLYISLRHMSTIVLKQYCVFSACALRKVKPKQFKQHVKPLLNIGNIEKCLARHVAYANGVC